MSLCFRFAELLLRCTCAKCFILISVVFERICDICGNNRKWQKRYICVFIRAAQELFVCISTCFSHAQRVFGGGSNLFHVKHFAAYIAGSSWGIVLVVLVG